MNNEQEIKQLKKDIVKGHAKNKYKNQGVQFTADQVVASLQEEQKANSHNICAECNETIRPDQWSENNFTLCIDCG